jgi:putative SOS response-associated peptidase YedK
MCGRFSLTQRLEVLERIFKAKARLKSTLPRYNVAPTQPILAISGDDPESIQEMGWGMTVFPTNGAPPRMLVNAKAETLTERPMYAQAFRERRCLILADGFYEWRSHAGKRIPQYFRLRSREPFAFAGIYDEENDARHAVIITTTPNELVAPVHNRMPVLLSDPQAWLREDDPQKLSAMLEPYDPRAMESFSVDPIVNSPENDSPECIAPYEPPQLGLF